MKTSNSTQTLNRLKQRFAEHGLDNFKDFEITELLLSFDSTNDNSVELSAGLIDRFGSFSRVLDAPFASLTDISELDDNSALWLKLLPQIAQKYSICKNNVGKKDLWITELSQIVEYLQPYFIAAAVE
jgi:DNA repair protein RadC